MQGSWHSFLTQARFLGHSELTVHSGLQSGGPPKYPGKHEHTGRLVWTLQLELGPQGLGLQGSCRGGGEVTEKKRYVYNFML